MTRGRGVFALVSSLFLTISAEAQSSHTLSGRVLDTADKPLVGVRIEIHRTGGQVLQDYSHGPDGRYSIPYSGSAGIDVVRYDYSEYIPDNVPNLASSDNHQLVKTLLRPTTSLTELQIRGSLCTFERLAAIDQANGTAAANADSFKYDRVLKAIGLAINSLAGPPALKDDLNRHLQAVKVAYKVQ